MAPNQNQRGTRREVRPARRQNSQRSDRRPTRSRRQSTQNTIRPAVRHVGCAICKSDHRIMTCGRFRKMNLVEKYRTVVKHHYCTNCLARNHLIDQCTNQTRCQKCGKRHHTFLHGPPRILDGISARDTPTPATQRSTAPVPAPRTINTSSTSTALPLARARTLVPTALVQVAVRDRLYLARTVLNPSLTTSRIAASLVRKANLIPFTVENKVYVKMSLVSNVTSSERFEVCPIVVEDLPRNLYEAAMDSSTKERLCRISLADPEFYSNTPVALEIGGDLYTTLLKPNSIRIEGSLVAQDSVLGWLVMGSMSN